MQLPPHKRENVLPLPVVLVSTMSRDGVRNIAPWGNVTPILRPLDEIVIASWIKRDTLANIRETGEFVVNVPVPEMIDQIMICARNYPPEVDEFVESGLVPKASKKVAPPGVEGAIACMECSLAEEIVRERFSLIIGKVEHLEVDERYFDEEGDMDFVAARPLCMVCGNEGTRFAVPTPVGRETSHSEMFLGKRRS